MSKLFAIFHTITFPRHHRMSASFYASERLSFELFLWLCHNELPPKLQRNRMNAAFVRGPARFALFRVRYGRPSTDSLESLSGFIAWHAWRWSGARPCQARLGRIANDWLGCVRCREQFSAPVNRSAVSKIPWPRPSRRLFHLVSNWFHFQRT